MGIEQMTLCLDPQHPPKNLGAVIPVLGGGAKSGGSSELAGQPI